MKTTLIQSKVLVNSVYLTKTSGNAGTLNSSPCLAHHLTMNHLIITDCFPCFGLERELMEWKTKAQLPGGGGGGRGRERGEDERVTVSNFQLCGKELKETKCLDFGFGLL